MRSLAQQALDAAGQKVGALRSQRDESLAGLHDAEWHLAAVAETIRSRAAYAEGVRNSVGYIQSFVY